MPGTGSNHYVTSPCPQLFKCQGHTVCTSFLSLLSSFHTVLGSVCSLASGCSHPPTPTPLPPLSWSSLLLPPQCSLALALLTVS